MRIGKTISYILRHHPEDFDIELDEEGYVDVDILLDALRQYGYSLSLVDLEKLIVHSDKKRYEIVDNRIRALYGHSFKNKVTRTPVRPPDLLYHGTTHKAYESIKLEGIKKMERQYVHLSSTIDTAIMVGKRRDAHPIVLVIEALVAYEDGYEFYYANDSTWLCNQVDVKYIKECIES